VSNRPGFFQREQFDAAAYPEVEGTRCITIYVPDDDAYAVLAAGVLALMTDAAFWRGTDAQRLAASQACLAAYDMNDFGGCMDCAGVADCIENDPAVWDAVKEALYQNDAQFPNNPAILGDVLYKANCDKDAAAGYIRTGVVDRAVQNIIDMLETLEATTNDEEVLDAFIDLIPLGGALLDEVIIFDIPVYVNSIREWIQEEFLAEDTTALREETYSDLLCLYMQNCNLSVEKMRDYFWEKATKINPDFNSALGTAGNLLGFLIGGTVTEFSGIWYVLMATQFGLGYFISEMFGMSLAKFKLLSALGEPTDDWIAWEILYGECECVTAYAYPERNAIELDVLVGVTGVVGVLAFSEDVEFPPDGFAQTIVADMLIPVVGAKLVTFVMSENTQYALQVSTGVATYVQDTTVPYALGAGLWAIDATLPDISDDLVSFLIRTHPIGNSTVYSLLEIRVRQDC
jgi:hypothetical protein